MDFPPIPIAEITYAWRLMAERTDGTGRMNYCLSNDKEELDERVRKTPSTRVRYWVEPNL